MQKFIIVSSNGTHFLWKSESITLDKGRSAQKVVDLPNLHPGQRRKCRRLCCLRLHSSAHRNAWGKEGNHWRSASFNRRVDKEWKDIGITERSVSFLDQHWLHSFGRRRCLQHTAQIQAFLPQPTLLLLFLRQRRRICQPNRQYSQRLHPSNHY